jgi:protein SCO1/2
MLRLLLASLLFFGMRAAGAQSPLKFGVFEPPRPAPDFALQGSDGAELRLSRYRGKVVAIGFGYTSCPDVCPTTLAELAEVRRKLGKAGKEFQVIYVTVDPERDSVERLRTYVTAFDPTFLGATGTARQLVDVRAAYGIQVSKQPIAGSQSAYLVHHSSFVYFIDRSGKLRSMMPFGGRSVDDITSDIKVLLRN